MEEESLRKKHRKIFGLGITLHRTVALGYSHEGIFRQNIPKNIPII
jgi:hypothetical protein